MVWKCTTCTFKCNEEITPNCSMCGSTRHDPNQIKSSPPRSRKEELKPTSVNRTLVSFADEEWICSRCTLLNQPLEMKCGVCGADRPEEHKMVPLNISKEWRKIKSHEELLHMVDPLKKVAFLCHVSSLDKTLQDQLKMVSNKLVVSHSLVNSYWKEYLIEVSRHERRFFEKVSLSKGRVTEDERKEILEKPYAVAMEGTQMAKQCIKNANSVLEYHKKILSSTEEKISTLVAKLNEFSQTLEHKEAFEGKNPTSPTRIQGTYLHLIEKFNAKFFSLKLQIEEVKQELIRLSLNRDVIIKGKSSSGENDNGLLENPNVDILITHDSFEISKVTEMDAIVTLCVELPQMLLSLSKQIVQELIEKKEEILVSYEAAVQMRDFCDRFINDVSHHFQNVVEEPIKNSSSVSSREDAIYLELCGVMDARSDEQEKLAKMKFEYDLLIQRAEFRFVNKETIKSAMDSIDHQEDVVHSLKMKEDALIQSIHQVTESHDLHGRALSPSSSRSISFVKKEIFSVLPKRVLYSGLLRLRSISDYEIVTRLEKSDSSDKHPGVTTYLARYRNSVLCVLKKFDLSNNYAVDYLDSEVHIRHKLHGRMKHPSFNSIEAIFVEQSTFDDPITAYVHQPYHTATDMKKWLKKEPLHYEIRRSFTQILQAIEFMHKCGIIHGNLKLVNILIREDSWATPVLTNFMNSIERYESLNVTLHSPTSKSSSTDISLSPDVHPESSNFFDQGISPPESPELTFSSDMWSFGMMMYLAHFDQLPVIDPNTNAIQIPFHKDYHLRELLESLLKCDPKQRPSATETLHSPYFTSNVIHALASNREISISSSKDRIEKLQTFLKNVRQRNTAVNELHIEVERGSVVWGLLTSLEFTTYRDLFRRFKTSYIGHEVVEIGVDAGGLSADLITEFFLKVVSPETGLFASAPEEDSPPSGLTYLPVKNSELSGIDISYYKSIGKLLCKCLLDGRTVPASFAPSLIKFLLGIDPDITDVEAYDRSLASSYRKILLLPDIEEHGLDFGDADPSKGGTLVTDANKRSYIDKLVQKVLVKDRSVGLEALREGFYSLPGLEDECRNIAPEDLASILCGVPRLDFDIIDRQLVFVGFLDNTTPHLLREVLLELNEQELRRFLRLSTSLAAVPINGLEKKISIRRLPKSERLPVGHTCSHELDLPDYQDKELLRFKLLMAISHVDVTGFGYV